MAGTLTLVGGGKMGGALLAGWLDRGTDPASVVIVEPFEAARDDIAANHGVPVAASADDLAADHRPEVIVFAVKPQDMAAVAPSYRRFVDAAPVFLSIAAGTTIAFFEKHLGANAAIVRSMPNTPAAVRRGITVACPNGHVSAAQRERCDGLLAAVGEVAWIDDEGLLDAVTGVSGSGPAYVFLLAECMAEAGVAAGLPPDLAARLANATVAGSGELLRLADDGPDVLRKNVTSPGGTTAAALEVLMAADAMPAVLREAIAAATKRSRELAG